MYVKATCSSTAGVHQHLQMTFLYALKSILVYGLRPHAFLRTAMASLVPQKAPQIWEGMRKLLPRKSADPSAASDV